MKNKSILHQYIGYPVIIITALTFSRAMTNEQNDTLSRQLTLSNNATSVIVMIIPTGVAFRTRVDEVRLAQVACVYEIVKTEAMQEIANLLRNKILAYSDSLGELHEVRIGIIFKNNNDILSIYLEAWGGQGI